MGSKIHIDEDELRQMAADDIQNHLIAKHFGCSESCIERRLKKLGIKKSRTGPKSGDRHTNWKGGRVLVKGYWYIWFPDHPNVTRRSYVLEHRLVMEQKLGRYLDRKEVVHHIDGDSQNNHPDNLMLFSNNGEHLKHELTGKVPNWSPEGYASLCAPLKDYDDLSESGKERRRAAARRRRNQSQSKSDAPLGTQTTDHHSS